MMQTMAASLQVIIVPTVNPLIRPSSHGRNAAQEIAAKQTKKKYNVHDQHNYHAARNTNVKCGRGTIADNDNEPGNDDEGPAAEYNKCDHVAKHGEAVEET